MRLPIHQVDAFAGRLFAGNPAAVVIVRDELPDETLQAVAAENNLSETAFVWPAGERFRLRWFTPRAEVDLCGHATLASAFVLFAEGLAGGETVRFETCSGGLAVSRRGDLLTLDFPSRPARPVPVPAGLEQALGARPVETHAADRDLLALFETPEHVAALRPRFDALERLEPMGFIATAPGRDVDFVSRFFAPEVGVPEDPVTGSAHCTLTPFWSEKLGKKELRARQISQRGGELLCEDRGERVSIGGRAVEYLRGEIRVSG